MVKSHVEESLGANPADAALNPADSVAMGVQSATAPKELRGGAFRALGHREYRLLFAAFCVNQMGFWLSHISMQGLMVELSGNDPQWLGYLFFALFLPTFLLAPIAGVAADRLDRKRIMVSCYGAVSFYSAVLAYVTTSGLITAPMLLVISLLLGSAFAFAGPSSFALAANAVPSEDLPSAVSMQSAANNLTRVVGPLMAAPMLATGRLDIAFASYVVTASASALMISRMRPAPFVPDDDGLGILGRLREGVDHAVERRPAAPILLTVAVMTVFGVSHGSLISVYAESVLDDRAYFAWIVSATGLGSLLGAITVGFRKERSTLRGSALGMVFYSISMALSALSEDLMVALVVQFAVGFFYFSMMTNLQTLIQQIVDESKRGRIMAPDPDSADRRREQARPHHGALPDLLGGPGALRRPGHGERRRLDWTRPHPRGGLVGLHRLRTRPRRHCRASGSPPLRPVQDPAPRAQPRPDLPAARRRAP
jgi:MFS family permease